VIADTYRSRHDVGWKFRLDGSADGTGAAVRFSEPYGVAVNGSGIVHVADTLNSTIRKITEKPSSSTDHRLSALE
jgi:hypothetical protein